MGLKKITRLLAIALTGIFLSSCGDGDTSNMAESKGGDAGRMVKIRQVVADKLATSKGFSSEQEKAIAQIVRKTLLARPEILQEAFAVLEERDKAEQEKRKLSALSESADTLFRSKLSPVGGNPKGDVTVVEFFDYNCPYCRKAFKDLETIMGIDKNLRVVFKEYPIFGGASQIAAKAALAAEKQGKYFQFHKALLEVDSRVTEDMVYRKAQEIGLDIERLKKDMESSDIAASIAETKRLADRLGIRGTPAFFVGDKLIPGAPRNLVQLMKNHAADIRKNGCKNC
jgi:protein-disulfide isomerase